MSLDWGKSLSFLLIILLVSSCGDNESTDKTDRSELSHRLKRITDASAFESRYKQALVDYYNNNQFVHGAYLESDGSPNSSQQGDSASGGRISATNLQEAGVDESDRIKSDGHYLYVLSASEHFYPADTGITNDASTEPKPDNGGESNTLRVFELQTDLADATLLAEKKLDFGESLVADGLYLTSEDRGNILTLLASSRLYYPYWYDSIGWSGSSSALSNVDLSDPARPVQSAGVVFDGQIISSRRVGDHLIIANRFFPAIEEVVYYPQTDDEKSSNQNLIEELSLQELLPGMSVDNNTTRQPLVDAENCFVPDSAESLGYSPDIISLISININDLTIESSLCFVGSTETFYASTEAVYLATTRYDWELDENGWVDYQSTDIETDIHRFSFDQGQLSYSASGKVKGQLGWNVDRRPFRLSEKDNYLRVVSFTAELEDDKSPVRLSVLHKEGQDLLVTATLPNSTRPEPLGRPGEQLYASRFVGDRAYFVTFRVTDPLYVIDLSDPRNPFVSGELKIEGYSDYLHPVSDSLLLGLGKDAIADTTGDFDRGAWYQGLKLSLIDVSNPSSAVEVDKMIIGKRGSESPALADHHAFTYLPADRSGSLAIPVRLHDGNYDYGEPGKPWSWYQWQHSGLYLFDVDISTGTLSEAGYMEVANRNTTGDTVSIHQDRSLLAGDAVYYVNGDKVYGAFWNSPQNLNGPR